MKIFNWFKKRKKQVQPAAKIIEERTYNDGDSCTDWENTFIKKFKCPDCEEHAILWDGPSGGASQNMKCPFCGSEFNVFLGGYAGDSYITPIADRISNSSLHATNKVFPNKHMKMTYLGFNYH